MSRWCFFDFIFFNLSFDFGMAMAFWSMYGQ